MWFDTVLNHLEKKYQFDWNEINTFLQNYGSFIISVKINGIEQGSIKGSFMKGFRIENPLNESKFYVEPDSIYVSWIERKKEGVKGVGKDLLLLVAAHAADIGYSLTFDAVQTNASRNKQFLVQFYNSIGFSKIRITKNGAEYKTKPNILEKILEKEFSNYVISKKPSEHLEPPQKPNTLPNTTKQQVGGKKKNKTRRKRKN
jgi:hypothetical protein